MDYLFQDGGKSKTSSKSKSSESKSKTSSKSSKSKSSSKKGGNFLGTVGELVAPTGWEGFATAAGLLAIDRADAALRRGTSKKKSEKSSANKGGSTKKTSSKKGGNFLGAVGELVAPTGWESFATTAGLFAIDRADAALRRGKSTKSSAKKGGMRGGYSIQQLEMILATIQQILSQTGNLSESNSNSLAHIRGSYAEFLNLYKQFLKNKEQKPQNTNTPDKKQKYIHDMIRKLSPMIGNLRNVLSVLNGIRNSQISQNIIDRLDLVKYEISGIIDFLTPQYEEYLSKSS